MIRQRAMVIQNLSPRELRIQKSGIGHGWTKIQVCARNAESHSSLFVLANRNQRVGAGRTVNYDLP